MEYFLVDADTGDDVMRKTIIYILLTVLLVCLCSCQKANVESGGGNPAPVVSAVEESNVKEPLSEKLIREIDGAYLEEQKKLENDTTIGMVQLTNKYTDEWKQVADEYYDKIMEYDGVIQPSEAYYSSDDLYTFVSNMKINWEQYNQEQCDSYMKTLQTIYGAGTIVGPLFAEYEYEMQKDWALQLVEIYERLY